METSQQVTLTIYVGNIGCIEKAINQLKYAVNYLSRDPNYLEDAVKSEMVQNSLTALIDHLTYGEDVAMTWKLIEIAQCAAVLLTCFGFESELGKYLACEVIDIVGGLPDIITKNPQL